MKIMIRVATTQGYINIVRTSSNTFLKILASQKVQTIPKMIAISGPPTDNLIQ